MRGEWGGGGYVEGYVASRAKEFAVSQRLSLSCCYEVRPGRRDSCWSQESKSYYCAEQLSPVWPPCCCSSTADSGWWM